MWTANEAVGGGSHQTVCSILLASPSRKECELVIPGFCVKITTFRGGFLYKLHLFSWLFSLLATKESFQRTVLPE